MRSCPRRSRLGLVSMESSHSFSVDSLPRHHHRNGFSEIHSEPARTIDRYRNACQSSIGLELDYRDSIDCSDIIMHSLQTVHGYHVRITASLVLHPSEHCRTHPSTSLVYQASRQSAEKRHRNTRRHSDTARCCCRTHLCMNPMPCMRHGRMGSRIAASTCMLTRHRS